MRVGIPVSRIASNATSVVEKAAATSKPNSEITVGALIAGAIITAALFGVVHLWNNRPDDGWTGYRHIFY